ncbi:DEAD/DEAH box helicase [Salinirubellus salinus]|uniref:DEAD/DEAH box helicase n=1 Tax=Salinirubellus salinus TaxID=1364945 RepID=A0A9E7R7G8_9EURY|nr:DEAD/DEAH box helicase [Salinirubellus salinus]UWM56080.1 DEAD/DEAH box helicase [Salinirubellus salinus]
MDETVEWLRDRPYFDDQLQTHEIVAGRAAAFGDEIPLESRLASALADRGIDRLYAHQHRAVEAVRAGRNVVLSTPTASGKSLAYTVPAFERAMGATAHDPAAAERADDGSTLGTALYVAPQVALVNDQEETLSGLADALGFGSGVQVAQYTGRQSRSEKAAIRERQPTVLLVTPDMLHYGILPHAHRLWDWFFERLSTVVVDEVHAYRGVFGSHVSLVLRRLGRVAERFGAAPEYVCCSATIRNPVEHAATVTAQPAESFVSVETDTSATGPRHWLFWNPPEHEGNEGTGRRRSSHTESKRLFVDLVERGYQTVVFCRSRQTAERYATDSADELRKRGAHEAARGVGAYQAALTDERRAEIEAGLKSGETRGVWSTNALELGVDIGGLDCVILDGYPGTRMSAFQQAGRAGRGTDPALVVLVGGEDQLDQYFMRHPDAFFEGDPERAVTNPENDQLAPGHVRSAASENWLSTDDERWFGESFPDLVSHLESTGDLQRRSTADGTRWTTDGAPQQDVHLRTIDDRSIRLLDTRRDEVVAELPFEDALRDAHRGAVYHHQGRKYEVRDLNLDQRVAELEPTWADYYTRTLHDKTITVERDLTGKRLATRDDVPVRFAEVTMRKQITGFERKDARTGQTIGEEELDVPETSLRTRGLYFTVPADVESAMRESAHDDGERDSVAASGDFDGGIHAAEHGMIAMFPTTVLCDRRDVGGLSTPMHPHTGVPTIFIYDGYPGGVGLARSGYEDVEALMETTREMIRECPCESGCPACVQSPHCGNANDPLDERLAVQLLDGLLD